MTSRHFIQQTTALAGAVLLTPTAVPAATAKKTAVDQVALGKSGLKICRLGSGTGSNSGNVQRSLGRDGFNRLILHA